MESTSELPHPGPGVAVVALVPELDALRIQAAAVAAQQAALTEEETRLLQRQTALERHEEQLAAHLEERRRQLLALQEQHKQERAALEAERAAFAKESAQARRELAQARADATLAAEEAVAERNRLQELRRRLKKRWHRHWQWQLNELRRREKEIGGERERQQQERVRLQEARLRFNGEAELGKRQLRDGWNELALAQRQWEERQIREQGALEQKGKDLNNRAAAVAEREQALAAEEQRWQAQRNVLEKEVAGLQSRTHHLRRKLQEQQQELANREAALKQMSLPLANPEIPVLSAPPVVLSASSGELSRIDVDWLLVLERFAGDLADQRLHLLEQWQALVAVVEAWQQEHAILLTDLEEAGRRLQEREQVVHVQEQALAVALMETREQQNALSRTRWRLEAWQARLRVLEASLEGERASLLAAVQAREEAAAERLRHVDDLRQRWLARRRKEAEEWRACRQQSAEVRQHFLALWKEYRGRRASLTREQRALAVQALALERFRQEWLGRVPNPVKAEKRIERLARKIADRNREAERHLARASQLLTSETARLEKHLEHVQGWEEELANRQEELSERQTEWESQQARAEDGERLRLQELERLHLQRQHYQRQVEELRDEVERLARLLIEDGNPADLPNNRAA
jgi:hypothetical protein